MQARQSAGAGEGLPKPTSRALGKLLHACGLESEFSGGVYVLTYGFVPGAYNPGMVRESPCMSCSSCPGIMLKIEAVHMGGRVPERLFPASCAY